jgi:2-keto-4-pentenoate hydratase/2-oxohepta-3-ene-1,7-dioic acid hydratase in catechol pathway
VRFGTLDRRFVLVDKSPSGLMILDVETASSGLLPADAVAALERWDEVCSWAPGADWTEAEPIAIERLGPPVPTPRQVFAVALNYAPHAAEAGFEPPAEPLVFTKFPSCVTGGFSTVELPPGHVDWEVEVVAVIGRGGHRIPRGQAWDAVAGITLGQDLSERLVQLAGKPAQFSLGKSFPGFGPIGPLAVTPDELADRDDLAFECSLRSQADSDLGPEVLQHGRTSQLIFPVDDLVARLSAICRLLPGDLIFTGTPEGVGNRRTPPRFLQPGDVLTSRLEGVGEIRQTFTGA